MDNKINQNFDVKILNSPFKNKFNIRFDTSNYNHLNLLMDQDIKYKVVYHFYGVFHPKMNMFFWGNIIPGINKNFYQHIVKIRNMKHLFEDFSQKNNDFYYQVLNEDTIIFKDPEEINKLKKLILYLSNDKDIIMPLSQENKFQIIGIENIIEKY